MSEPTLTARGLVLSVAMCSSAGLAIQQEPLASRETAVMLGRVVNDVGAPIAAARVTLSDASGPVRRDVSTDGDGQFTFEALGAGDYRIAASSRGHVTAAFGALPSDPAGMSIALRSGQRREGLTLTLSRSAAISGRATDQFGVALRNASVVVLRRGFRGGKSRFQPVPEALGGITDDVGAFRVYGLRAGSYLVALEPPTTARDGSIRPTTFADVERAMRLIRDRPSNNSATAGAAAAGSDAPTVGYSRIYYPSASFLGAAIAIDLVAGEEKTAIDVQRIHVQTAQLTGILSTLGGVSPTEVRLWMRPASEGTPESTPIRAKPDGTFVATGVLPGDYILGAESSVRRFSGGLVSTTGSLPTVTWLSARTPIVVTGANRSDVSLVLQPAMRVTGHVRFDPPAQGSVTAAGFKLALEEAGEPVWYSRPEAELRRDGSFEIVNVAPGQYYMAIQPPPGWFLHSVRRAQSEDAVDPLEVRQGDAISDLLVVFTSRTAELSGRISNARGEPAPAHALVLFPAERRLWTTSARRAKVARPDADGVYSITGILSGDYLIAAVTDVEVGQWLDPAFLEALAVRAVPLSLAAEQRAVRDFQVGSSK
jgi:hypothetical protein